MPVYRNQVFKYRLMGKYQRGKAFGVHMLSKLRWCEGHILEGQGCVLWFQGLGRSTPVIPVERFTPFRVCQLIQNLYSIDDLEVLPRLQVWGFTPSEQIARDVVKGERGQSSTGEARMNCSARLQ